MKDAPVAHAVTSAEHAQLERMWASPPGALGVLRNVAHKSIALRYIVSAFGFFALGGVLALLMRAQLARPEARLLGPDLVDQLVDDQPIVVLERRGHAQPVDARHLDAKGHNQGGIHGSGDERLDAGHDLAAQSDAQTFTRERHVGGHLTFRELLARLGRWIHAFRDRFEP